MALRSPQEAAAVPVLQVPWREGVELGLGRGLGRMRGNVSQSTKG